MGDKGTGKYMLIVALIGAMATLGAVVLQDYLTNNRNLQNNQIQNNTTLDIPKSHEHPKLIDSESKKDKKLKKSTNPVSENNRQQTIESPKPNSVNIDDQLVQVKKRYLYKEGYYTFEAEEVRFIEYDRTYIIKEAAPIDSEFETVKEQIMTKDMAPYYKITQPLFLKKKEKYLYKPKTPISDAEYKHRDIEYLSQEASFVEEALPAGFDIIERKKLVKKGTSKIMSPPEYGSYKYRKVENWKLNVSRIYVEPQYKEVTVYEKRENN